MTYLAHTSEPCARNAKIKSAHISPRVVLLVRYLIERGPVRLLGLRRLFLLLFGLLLGHGMPAAAFSPSLGIGRRRPDYDRRQCNDGRYAQVGEEEDAASLLRPDRSGRKACTEPSSCLDLVDASGRTLATQKQFAVLVGGAASCTACEPPATCNRVTVAAASRGFSDAVLAFP